MPKTSLTAGLIAGEKPIPLEGVRIEGQITGFGARVVVAQRYRNTEAQPIEAVYVFPVDEAAAVCGFEALIDDVRVVGKVMEREKAFEHYDDAMASGHGAYLLDQERPDVFTASIGNVPPGKSVLIRITYVTELIFEGADLRFTLPTTVSPRYAPAEDRVGVGRPPVETLNPPLGWTVPYGLELALQLEMPEVIRKIESPSHPVSVRLDGSRAEVTLGTRQTAMDRDFVLIVEQQRAFVPRCAVEIDDRGQRAAVVWFRPEFEVKEISNEVVFLIDCSGSMAGTSIAEARNALQLCLRSLPAGTHFNVVSFGSEFEMLFKQSQPYDEQGLAQASKYVAAMDANMGGTEILPALKAILETKPQEGRPRQLFVVTDGEVTNSEAVIDLVTDHRASTRVFSFGIGAGASHHLVRGIARAGRGAAAFIYPGERIEKKVMLQFQRALKSAITDLEVNWHGLKAQQAPYEVPPVFQGEWLRVYAFLNDAAGGDVTLSAAGPSGPLSFSVRLDPEYARSGDLIAKLSARSMIRDLEEGTSALHERGGSKQRRQREDPVDPVKQEIVRLGIQHQLCSSATSFLAIEQRENPVTGDVELRRVPVALTAGWGNIEMPMLSQFTVPLSMSSLLSASLADRMEDFEEASYPSSAFDDDRAILPVHAKQDPFDRIVVLQRADGSWDLTGDLAGILSCPVTDLEAVVQKGGGEIKSRRKAWATALAIAWLHASAVDRQAEWTMLEAKARKWLDRCTASLQSSEPWLDAAVRFLSERKSV